MSDYKKEIMEAFRKKFELHDVGKSQFTICTNSGDNTCNGGVSVDEIELESAEKLLENIESFLSQALTRMEEAAREEVQKELQGDLLPILEATRKWTDAHMNMRADEIVFDELEDEYGYKTKRPWKAIYYSPLYKFQSVSPSEEKEESREKECECICHYTLQVLTTPKGATLRKECSHCSPKKEKREG